MSVKIDAQDFEVRVTREKIGGPGGSRVILGTSDQAANAIIIDGTMPDTRQEEVFLHELIHLAVPSLPEFVVADVGVGLFGILKDNGLLAKGFFAKALDGDASEEQEREINERSNDIAEKQEDQGVFREVEVSEKPFAGNPFAEDGKVLAIHSGPPNARIVSRTGAYLAASRLVAGSDEYAQDHRVGLARGLIRVFSNELRETASVALHRLAGMR